MPRPDYPAAIPDLKTDWKDGDDAGDETPGSTAEGPLSLALNRAAEEVEAIAAELGIAPSGAMATVADRLDPMKRRSKLAVLFDADFCEGGSAPLTSAVAGTGGTASATTPGDQNHPGLLRLATGTTATGRAAATDTMQGLLFGGGKMRFETVIQIPILSTAAEEFIIRAGFGDSASADMTDGAYFEYDRLSSTNWRLKTANSGVRTTVDSGIAVATGYVKLRVEVNAAGTQADFYINDVLVTDGSPAPLTTNIPTGAGRTFGVVAGAILKSAGLTNREAYLDTLYVDQELTTPR